MNCDKKFVNSLISNQIVKCLLTIETSQRSLFVVITDFDYGFELCTLPDTFMSDAHVTSIHGVEYPIDQHFIVKRHGIPNFLSC